MSNKNELLSNGVIWFGAGVSIAEIVTGTYFAPLGVGKAALALVTGHLVGFVILFAMGLISSSSGKPTMLATATSFGKWGSIFFATVNIIQLLGWTSIMIYDAAISLNEIRPNIQWLWSILIGVLIIFWILAGTTDTSIIQNVAVVGLFALTIILSITVFKNLGSVSHSTSEAISFGAAFELAIAMPLSWVPLIGDYTHSGKHKVATPLVSSLVYTVVSTWMAFIGMCTAIYTNEQSIATIMVKAGMGIIGLLIIVFSTVTTTYLDAFSAGVSALAINAKFNDKLIAVIVTVVGGILAIMFPMDNITDFLYLIGSVFAPMFAIMVVDFFINKKDHSTQQISVVNIVIWVIGFVIYRVFMRLPLVVGSTLPAIVITMFIAFCANVLVKKNVK